MASFENKINFTYFLLGPISFLKLALSWLVFRATVLHLEVNWPHAIIPGLHLVVFLLVLVELSRSFIFTRNSTCSHPERLIFGSLLTLIGRFQIQVHQLRWINLVDVLIIALCVLMLHDGIVILLSNSLHGWPWRFCQMRVIYKLFVHILTQSYLANTSEGTGRRWNIIDTKRHPGLGTNIGWNIHWSNWLLQLCWFDWQTDIWLVFILG